MQWLKKICGSFDLFLRYGGLNFKNLGVSITPNFLLRRGTNHKYFLSAENIIQIRIKHSL